MIYLFIGISIALVGMVAGHYLTTYIWQSKVDGLLDNLKKLYPREFEVWRCGYRRACHDLFNPPDSD